MRLPRCKATQPESGGPPLRITTRWGRQSYRWLSDKATAGRPPGNWATGQMVVAPCALLTLPRTQAFYNVAFWVYHCAQNSYAPETLMVNRRWCGAVAGRNH